MRPRSKGLGTVRCMQDAPGDAPGGGEEHVQAWLELQLEMVDDGEITDGEESEHRPEVPSYQTFDSVYGACYACRDALSQRRGCVL